MTIDHANDILLDGFSRVRESLHAVVDGLDASALNWRPAPDANSIAWLGWHLARVQDDHLAGVSGSDQVWFHGWQQRFALPLPVDAIGYGQSPGEARAVVADSPGLLTGYYDAVSARTVEILTGLTPADYERIVDERWDPPVTLAVRVVSVLNDVTQHIGQAAYVKGLLP